MKTQTVYEMKATFTFIGSVQVTASSESEAKKIAESGLGLTLAGGIHESDCRIKHWDFPSHPLREIGQPRWVMGTLDDRVQS